MDLDRPDWHLEEVVYNYGAEPYPWRQKDRFALYTDVGAWEKPLDYIIQLRQSAIFKVVRTLRTDYMDQGRVCHMQSLILELGTSIWRCKTAWSKLCAHFSGSTTNDFPRLQLHTEDDSQQSACDVRNGHSADEYKPAHLYCLLAPKSLQALMRRPDALEMGTTDSHDQFPIFSSTKCDLLKAYFLEYISVQRLYLKLKTCNSSHGQ
ncbi:hypothetical protein DPMN_103005 [Dreissena polymorpha]|uniref:Uncharacterized protein n=1 Tax=Dreissena polymorpha TaxID=45954 RepID=A0A9D4K269_DREPO|nr:hypothetical protein DPMN_103005 [Dreissena polymorpha]